jgi:GTP-binding protein
MSQALPVIAIIGRPNVGKSTLFNRLLSRRQAIESDIPGTTRDRLVGRADWDGRWVLLMDTGGLEAAPEESLTSKVRRQVEQGIDGSDLVLLVVDAQSGLHPVDQEVAQLVRRKGKPTLVVANKTEGRLEATLPAEFYALGFGEPVPVSAIHNRGIADLKESALARFPQLLASEVAEGAAPALQLAIVGRPNAGKSSLLNAIAGEERVIVHHEPGTTRDTVDMEVTYRGRRITLIDTAGLRRRGHIQQGIEQFSMLRVLQAIERCDVALVVMDATDLGAAQDAHVAGYAWDAYKGLVLVVNKWDLAADNNLTAESATRELRRHLAWAANAPICFVSALTGQGIPQVLEAAWRVRQERRKRVPQAELDAVLEDAVTRRPPSAHPAHRVHFYKLEQTQTEPPTFVVWTNEPKWVHFSYVRLLENSLRSAFGFSGNPLQILLKKRPPKVRASPQTEA